MPFTRYVKVAFSCEDDLDPLPPVDATDPNTRYVHIHEDDEFDEEQLTSWIEQASQRPGWVL